MSKSDIAEGAAVLRTSGWLSQTPSEFADVVLGHCHWRYLAAGSGIQHAGSIGRDLTGVACGTVAMSTGLSAPEVPVLHLGHPGFWFGFVSLFTDAALPNSIVAQTDVLLATICKSRIDEIVKQHPEWWRHLGMLGVDYGNTATMALADLMIRDNRRRCAAVLLRLADCRVDDALSRHVYDVPLGQGAIGAICNLSRSTASAILSEFEHMNLITLGYRSITVDDPGRMLALVNEC